MGITIVLGIAVAACAAGAILTHREELRRWHYVFKPLATLLILLLAWLGPADAGPGTRLLIGCGLVASLMGDIWLMLPQDRFLQGIASFAVAQACYIAAFGAALSARPAWWTALPYLAYAAAVMALLWRGAGPLRLPVAIYALLLTSMAWAAGARWAQARTGAALAGWIGAVLFVASDSMLALDRFRAPIPRAPLWVLGTYYAGQFLIALSA